MHVYTDVWYSGTGLFLQRMSVGYSLGMVKMEAFEDSHFMHQAVKVGLTDHTGSIVSLMACIFDLKKKFGCYFM